MISDCYSTWISQSIYAANKLAMSATGYAYADLLKRLRRFGKRNVNLQVFSERLLRALANMGVFTETQIGYCTLTQLVSCI